ncbi:enoyl-CoA hydratase-related protein [Sphingosinicella xenopeptidilytica]|uniref:Enoyl-CoA hydratase-related protein n=1 Tax=Sphingosinicella xenopeptidilytica TaxID=364098 RepID=A0ABW3C736_SPHXN
MNDNTAVEVPASDTLSFTLDENNVARVTLNRPERHNAFNAELIGALKGTFDAIAQMAGVRAVVLSGEGKSFSAGADLEYMRAAGGWSEAENVADGQRLSDMLASIAACPVPVIAIAKGNIFGGGVGLVSCADMVVGIEGVKFRLSEVRLGLTPATISPFVIAAIGARQAKRWFTTAELFGLPEAREMGLVHVGVADLYAADAQVDAWVDAILEAAPGAGIDAKALVTDFAGREITPALRSDSARRIAARRATEEAAEGLTAFLEKRRPYWMKTDA